MKEFLKSMLTDERGATSSKRIVGVLCTFSLLICLLLKITPATELITAVTTIAVASLGLTTVDKFTKPNE
jgi:hypothetical protein